NDSNLIFFPDKHGFLNGEAVVYHASDAAKHLGNLADGGIYYVIKVSDYAIKLADSYYHAVGKPDTDPGAGDNSIPITAINISSTASDTTTVHSLADPSLGGLTGGLTPGRTYYVIHDSSMATDSFKLAKTPGGSAI